MVKSGDTPIASFISWGCEDNICGTIDGIREAIKVISKVIK